MRKRWLATALALFIPTCAATNAVRNALAKRPVRGAVTTAFPILTIGSNGVDLVPLASGRWKSAQLRAGDVPAVENAVSKLVASSMSPDNTFATVTISAAASGMQSVHLNVMRDVAMGVVRSESWYDTDGQQIFPRYERERVFGWSAMESAAMALPISLAIAGCVAFGLRKKAPAQPVT
jgi:hypothetical protein